MEISILRSVFVQKGVCISLFESQNAVNPPRRPGAFASAISFSWGILNVGCVFLHGHFAFIGFDVNKASMQEKDGICQGAKGMKELMAPHDSAAQKSPAGLHNEVQMPRHHST